MSNAIEKTQTVNRNPDPVVHSFQESFLNKYLESVQNNRWDINFYSVDMNLLSPYTFYTGSEICGLIVVSDRSEFDRASINSLKERSGLTWSEFANLFSVSRRTVHAWNSGARMNSLHMERKQIITSFIDDTEPASPEEMRGVFLNLKDDGLTEYQKYVNNWNSAPIKTYERPLISNFTDPIYDDARTHEVVDSKEI